MTTNLYDNHFVLPTAEYKRDVDIFTHYVDDASTFLSLRTGKTKEECKAFVLAGLKKDGRFEFKDPKVEYLDREENGDRVRKATTLSRYIGKSVRENEIIAPTFTTYLSPNVKRSILGAYVEQNIKKRGVAKKEMFVAEAAKNMELYAIKKIEQTGRKLANNSISGAHVSASTPLYNKTAHSTLTSTCRTTSGYGNANNEKFLSGNRHYWSYAIVINNIIAVINTANYALIEEAMNKYSIHYPSVEEVMECITYSASNYFWDRNKTRKILDLVVTLNPLQRAVFVYSGDAYHLLKHNSDMMRVFLTRLSDRVTGEHSNPMDPIKSAPESYVNFAHQICYEETRGIGKNYKDPKIVESGGLHTLALTIENIAKTIVDYADLIRAFWMPATLPASVAYFPDSIRKSALTSDTDSTIFTVQDWIIWYSGGTKMTSRARAVYSAVVFLASSTITHVLAKMSANLGIIPEHLFKIQMKSEFTFDVFVPTQLGKHYFAVISCQEGNVKEELEYEIKGAQLRSANAPREIIQMATDMMKRILHDTLNNSEIVLTDYLKKVADIEREIERSVLAGELRYFRSGSIKDSDSYAGEAEDSPYQNHFMWQKVFASDYGEMPNPPYDTKKIPVTIDSGAKIKAWLDTIDNHAFKDRMVSYMASADKKFFGVFNLPTEILASKGIPKELMGILDMQKLKLDICRIFYIILETIGYYAVGDKTRKLVSQNGY